MANPNQVTGRAKVRIDGTIVQTAGDTTLDPGGVNREPVEGDYKAGSFRQGPPRPAKLDINILTNAGFSATAIGAMEDATISVEFDTGRSFVMNHSWSEKAPEVKTADGKAAATFYAEIAEELKA